MPSPGQIPAYKPTHHRPAGIGPGQEGRALPDLRERASRASRSGPLVPLGSAPPARVDRTKIGPSIILPCALSVLPISWGPMNDHREPIPTAPVHLLGDDLLPTCGGGGGPSEGGWCRMTPVSADVTCAPCRLVELRDPAGPTFVSLSGDRRERAVPCQRCRRSKTYALRGVCVPCLEAELEEVPAGDPCEGISDEALDAAEIVARALADCSCDWCNLTELPHKAAR